MLPAFVTTFVVLHAAMSVAFLCAVHYALPITDNERAGTASPRSWTAEILAHGLLGQFGRRRTRRNHTLQKDRAAAGPWQK
jgi:hypothetical protein